MPFGMEEYLKDFTEEDWTAFDQFGEELEEMETHTSDRVVAVASTSSQGELIINYLYIYIQGVSKNIPPLAKLRHFSQKLIFYPEIVSIFRGQCLT